MWSTIISLLCVAIGGNVAGALMKNSSLGSLWNSVAGIAGGGIGGTVLGAFGTGAAEAAGGGMDMGSILGSVASGGVGGGVVTAIIGLIKKAMAK